MMAHSQLMVEMVISSRWEANASNSLKKRAQKNCKTKRNPKKTMTIKMQNGGKQNRNKYKIGSTLLSSLSLQKCLVSLS